MFKLDSEVDLLATFRPKDRPQVELAPGTTFPLIVRGYTAWVHPSGGKVFLVFATPGGAPTGIAFSTNGASGAAVPHMCDWCHSMGPQVHSAMLTARIDAKRHAGVHVCHDLGCQALLEEEANRTGVSAKPAIERTIERMGRFASEVLKIDLSGANR